MGIWKDFADDEDFAARVFYNPAGLRMADKCNGEQPLAPIDDTTPQAPQVREE